MHAALARLRTTLLQLTSVKMQYDERSLRDAEDAAEMLRALPITHLRVEGRDRDQHIGEAAASCLSQLTVSRCC
jgi:hypothetical protein